MDVISSGQTFFIKRVFPLLWCGIMAVFLVAFLASGGIGQAQGGPMVLLGPVLMLAVFAVVYRLLIWGLADEVRDAGDTLLVRRGSTEARVALADVMNVSLSQFTNPRRLTLRLRTPGVFGDEIVFIPKAPVFQFNPFARNAIAESLIRRVDAARRGAGR